MAVFTPVTDADARGLLQNYELGELLSLRGISAGIENTNYFLTTTTGEYVLTLFEVLTYEQLPFYIELMHHLAQKGVPVPSPQTLKNGERLTKLHDKPCAIVSRLAGSFVPEPNPTHCALAAQTLAKTHLAAQDYDIYQPNLRSLPWWEKTIPTILSFLTDEQKTLIHTVLAEQQDFFRSELHRSLPSGPAHCDLFRDNVLFAGTEEQPIMGGFIDFYFAGCDAWIFDVAVSVNDWCIERDTGVFKPDLLRAWLKAYAEIRPFTEAEKQAWPLILQAAALRFWVSRLYDFFIPRPAQTLKPHDPTHFERVLLQRRQSLTSLDELVG